MRERSELIANRFPQASLVEGCRLPVRMRGGQDWPLAEIISIKDKGFYVHYVDCESARECSAWHIRI